MRCFPRGWWLPCIADVVEDTGAGEPRDVAGRCALRQEAPAACCERNLNRVMRAFGVVPCMTVGAHRCAPVKGGRRDGGCTERSLTAYPDHSRKGFCVVGAARVERAAHGHEAEAANDDTAVLADKQSTHLRRDMSEVHLDPCASDQDAEAVAATALHDHAAARLRRRRLDRRKVRRRRVLVLSAAAAWKLRRRTATERRALDPEHLPLGIEGDDPPCTHEPTLAGAEDVSVDGEREDDLLVGPDAPDAGDGIGSEAAYSDHARLSV